MSGLGVDLRPGADVATVGPIVPFRQTLGSLTNPHTASSPSASTDTYPEPATTLTTNATATATAVTVATIVTNKQYFTMVDMANLGAQCPQVPKAWSFEQYYQLVCALRHRFVCVSHRYFNLVQMRN